MPPIRKQEILSAENALGMPLVSEYKTQGIEALDFDENDIRLGVIAVADTIISPEVYEDRDLRTRLHLLYNLENYIDNHESGLITSQLRKGQQDVLHDVYDFIRTPPRSEDGVTVHRGFIKLPTGVGKTAIFSSLVDILNKPLSDSTAPLKSLVLVPKLDLVEQTVGTNGKRGFAQFGQGTSVSKYTAYEKDLTGDAVVMTYQSLARAWKSGVLTQGMFDLVICDEAHRALGEETAKAFEAIVGNGVTIGLTATPEYKTKHVSSLFPEEIHNLGLREAIETGLLSAVQCFAITSDAKIETIKSGDFTDTELSGLVENEWRNQRAVQFAKTFVEEGRQGLISCVPGGGTKHAQELAEQLKKEFIIDPKSGDLRRIKAMAMSGSVKDRQEIYSEFEAGEIDVFTYVDVLTEGWDSEVASFLINLRPTTSPVNATQRLGRVLRKSDKNKLATVIEFIDQTDKPLHTFFHILGEHEIKQGEIYGQPRSETRDSGASSSDPEFMRVEYDLSDELRELIAKIDHIQLASLIIERSTVDDAPEGSVSAVSFARQHEFSTSKFPYLLKKAGIEPILAKLGNKETLCLTPEMQELALQIVVGARPETAKDGVKSIAVISRELRMNQFIVERLIEEAAIPTITARFGPKIAKGLTQESQTLFYELPFLRMQDAPKDAMNVKALAAELGVSEITVAKFIKDEGIPVSKFKKKGKIVSYVLSADLDSVKTSLLDKLSRPPEGVVSVVQLGEELGLTPATMHRVVERLGIRTSKYKFGKAGVGAGLIKEDQLAIREAVEKSRDETNMSVVAFAARLHITKPTLLRVMKDLGLEPVKLLVGTGYVVPLHMRKTVESSLLDR